MPIELQPLIAQTGIPRGVEPATIPIRAGGLEYGALAQGTADLASAGLQISDQIRRLDQVKQEQAARIASADARSRLELGLQEIDTKLRTTIDDSDQYATAYSEAARGLHASIRSTLPTPLAQTLFDEHAPFAMRVGAARAFSHANDLYVQRNLGALDTTLDRIKILGASAPDTPLIVGTEEPGTAIVGKGASDYYAEGRAAITGLTAQLGPRVAADALLKFRTDFLDARLKTQINADPFATDIGKFSSVLKPETFTALQNYQTARQQQQMAQEDRAQRRLDAEIAKQRTATFANLTDRVLQGPTTEDEARRDSGWKLLDGSQRQHIIDMIRNPKVDPSDPATRSNVLDRALRTSPTINAEELTRLHNTIGPNGRPLLNDADFSTAMVNVRERGDYFRGQAKADAHRAEDQQRHTQEREQKYLDDTAMTALSLTGSIAERLDPKQQELKAIYRETMYRRSNTFRGQEDPEDIFYSILPNLMVRLADGPDGIKGDLGKLQRLVDLGRFKTKADLLKAKGRIPDGEFYESIQLFKDLDEAQRAYDAIQAGIKHQREQAAARGKK